MAASNPYLNVQLAGLRSSKQQWSNVKMRLAEELADIVLLRNFFQNWTKSGLTAAIDALPHDDPSTPQNEAVLFDNEKPPGIMQRAENFFGKKWSDLNSGDLNQLQSNVQSLIAKVYNILGRQYTVNSEMDEIDREISDITIIQKSQTV